MEEVCISDVKLAVVQGFYGSYTKVVVPNELDICVLTRSSRFDYERQRRESQLDSGFDCLGTSFHSVRKVLNF
jgi:hypothetical protein